MDVAMVDTRTPEQRSALMRRIRGKDTKPEMIVRRLVYGMGFRYRLHDPKLPGRPDLAFPGLKKIVFVHGCFWHGHRCRYGKLPKSRIDFWAAKIEANRRRDRSNHALLKKQGWAVLVIWQCKTRRIDQMEALRQRLDKFLSDHPKTRSTHR